MIIFIDGPQCVGKTTLIDYLVNKYGFKKYKFDFSKYTKLFNIEENSDLRNFQIGKDFSMLYWLSELENSNEKIIIDRGPLSSIYYSHLLNRMNEKDLKTYFDLISEFKNIKFILLFAKNKKEEIKRNKKDGFDNLSKEINEKTINFIINNCKNKNINLNIFYNDFSKNINLNGENLNYLIRSL